MADAELKERADLQQLIYKNAKQFFEEECGEVLFVLNEEVTPSNLVADRIDLLAVDSEGATVIVELKRGNDKLQLLQALTYAAMISGLTWEEIKTEKTDPGKLQALSEFITEIGLDEDSDDGQAKLNSTQRIVLIAESYNYEVLCTAQWLTDKWGLNITCYEVALARDRQGNAEYLSAVQLFPAKPLADQARRRGAFRSQATNEPRRVETKLLECSNEAIREFFEEILSQNPRRSKSGHAVVFPPMGKMRFRVMPRKQSARVRQLGRFDGDEQHWSALASRPVKAVSGGRSLVFDLSSAAAIDLFRRFIDTDLANTSWRNVPLESNDVDDDSDDSE